MVTRRERVVVEAVDELSTPFAKMAAAAVLLDRSLDGVDGSSVSARGGIEDLNDEVGKQPALLTQASREIDRYSGRLRLIGEAITVLGPALVPISAAAVPALAGLTTGLGAAVGAVGTAVFAFNGMGDALKAISEYRLDPTIENLEEMRQALEEVGPAGAEFARFLTRLKPTIDDLQNTARAGMFPGLQEGIEELMPLLPQVERIIGNLATAMGDLAEDAGEALSSERFSDFFDYIETDAGPTLDDFGRATGNLAEGLTNLMVAFAPLSRDFSGGLEDMSRSFADWTAGLSETEGFQEFVAYVRQSGPQVLDLLGSLGNALVGIAQAAAPFGQAVVPMLTAFADLLAMIAQSPIGPPLFTAAAGFVAVSRASNLAAGGLARFNAASAAGIGGAGFATKVAGVAAAFSILGNELAKINGSKVDISELGADLDDIAKGGGADAIDNIVQSIKTLQQGGPDAYEIPTLGGLFGNTPRDNSLEQIEAWDQKLAELVASGNAEKAAKVFDRVMSAFTGTQGNFSPTFGKTASQFDAYATALESVGPAAQSAAKGLERAAVQTQRTRAEMIAARAAARGTAGSFITLGDSLDDSKKSLSEWIDQLQSQAEALRNFTRNARTAARRGLDEGLSASLKEAGTAGAMRMRQLANATDAEIKRANKAWREGQQAIREYVNMEVPPKTPRVDTGPAFNAIAALKVALRNIPDEQVNVSMVYKRAAIDVATGEADGGFVPKTGLPYADRHPYLLADGEGVTTNKNGETDLFRDVISGINAGMSRQQVKGMLADGGIAGRRSIYDRSHAVPVASSRASSQTITVSSASLAGLRIEGRVDVDGREGYLRGVIRQEIAAEKRFDQVKAGGRRG